MRRAPPRVLRGLHPSAVVAPFGYPSGQLATGTVTTTGSPSGPVVVMVRMTTTMSPFGAGFFRKIYLLALWDSDAAGISSFAVVLLNPCFLSLLQRQKAPTQGAGLGFQ